MNLPLIQKHHDLVSPDGFIQLIEKRGSDTLTARVLIEKIPPYFLYDSPLLFNLKSTLAQIGIEASLLELSLHRQSHTATLLVELKALTPLAAEFLPLLERGAFVGKLFAKEKERQVRSKEVLLRQFDRLDEKGEPLLWLGAKAESSSLSLEIVDGRVIAWLSVLPGFVEYEKECHHFLPTLAKLLSNPRLKSRELLQLHQTWHRDLSQQKEGILLVKTEPLHIRTMFAKVATELLEKETFHTSANLLEPETKASGNIYELYGSGKKEQKRIPLEFYTLDPYRQYLQIEDDPSFLERLESPEQIRKAFNTAPAPKHLLSSTFIVTNNQLSTLSPENWISRERTLSPFPGIKDPKTQAAMVHNFLGTQPCMPFLSAMHNLQISSEGALFLRHFPTPLLKQQLLSRSILSLVRRIYFQHPSLSYGDFFSHEDRSFLTDLSKFGILVFWYDENTQELLQYVPKAGKDSGMFVKPSEIETFSNATLFGIYGSNLIEPSWEEELLLLFSELKTMKEHFSHPLFNAKTPLALVTGGGPGAMNLGNRIARKLGILSCANIMDFRGKTEAVVNEQLQNPYIDAKMTYRLDSLVERQAEFHLDFPIFFPGGVGTDFEYALEEVRRKVGAIDPFPVILAGDPGYWETKISPRFELNAKTGTIAGSEWVSNCFYAAKSAKEALRIYREFFRGSLQIGKGGPIYPKGFVLDL